MQERRAVHLLIRDLADKKLTVRVEAERKLKLLGVKAAGDLILALENRHLAVTTMPAEKNEVARARAARVLGAIGGKRPAPHLMRALGEKNALVQRAVIGALGDLRHKPAVPDLIKLSADANAEVAAAAVRALGNIGDRAALKTLLGVLTSSGALKKKYDHDTDVSLVRSAAAFALGMLGDTAAVPELLKALRDPDRRVRQHADLALRAMSGRNVRFKASAPEAERERAAKVWEAWWEAKLNK
ncbi:MAG: HEAT repeat domain-containing protein [Planctomycetota bacterium]